MKPLTGGDDGINFSMPPTFTFGHSVWSFTDPTFQYFFILLTVSLCFYLMHRVIRSPLGKAFVAIRDNDVRASLIGLNVYLIRLVAFVMAGFLAGVAGALFAFFGRYASATYMFYQVSGEGVVWAIVGGAGTLFGPIIGTTLFIIIREVVSTHWEHHSLIVGVMAILVVILAPRASSASGVTGSTASTETPQNCRRTQPSRVRAMSAPILRNKGSDQTFRRPHRGRQPEPEPAGRKAACHHRTEWRRQDHVFQPDIRLAAARCRSRSFSAAATSPACQPTRSAGSASSEPCRSKASFRSLSVAENLWITYAGSKRFLHPFRNAESDRAARERVDADARTDRPDRAGTAARPARCRMAMLHCSRSEWRLFPNRSCCCSTSRPAA